MKRWRLDDPLSDLIKEKDIFAIRCRISFVCMSFTLIGIIIGSLITISLVRSGWIPLIQGTNTITIIQRSPLEKVSTNQTETVPM